MKSKNIAVLFPKLLFSPLQHERLASLGKVTFIESVSSIVKCPRNTEVLVFDPHMVDGVTKARNNLLQIVDALPNIKYVVLGSSDSSFIDLDYCRQKGIIVSSIPFYDVESKAEHTIALLLGCMRRIFINDRRTYRRRYYPEPGHNFSGNSLGVIGINHTGERVVKLAQALGSAVNIYDEKTIRIEGTHRMTLDALLANSDMITLHLSENEESKKFLDKDKIKRIKEGAIVINIGDRNWVDERAMNDALVARQVDTYCFEGESIHKSPLDGNEFAVMFKPFSSYTKETLEKNTEAMIRNIEGIVRGIPFCKVEYAN